MNQSGFNGSCHKGSIHVAQVFFLVVTKGAPKSWMGDLYGTAFFKAKKK